jgi:hypothetical protein
LGDCEKNGNGFAFGGFIHQIVKVEVAVQCGMVSSGLSLKNGQHNDEQWT